jgi:DNA-directed RNA polymerase specialized sigma subunit
MWDAYHEVVRKYPPISLEAERKLIALAQEGHKESRDELLLRHVGFVIFRLHRKIFRREHLRRYGEDLLSETIPLLIGKIDDYDLEYRDPSGHLKPVRFSSYIWKRIDGHIIDSLKEQLRADASENSPDVELLAAV